MCAREERGEKGRGRRGWSGPPVAAWPGRHGDPWSLCSCSPALSADKPSPKKIPSSENLRANAEWRSSKGDVFAYPYTHFVVLSRHVNRKTRPAKYNRACVFCLPTSYITGILFRFAKDSRHWLRRTDCSIKRCIVSILTDFFIYI